MVNILYRILLQTHYNQKTTKHIEVPHVSLKRLHDPEYFSEFDSPTTDH